MRTLLLSAALALSTTLSTPVADACGSYGSFERAPQTFVISTHFTPHGSPGQPNGRNRTFVLLGSQAPAGLAWKQLAPTSYDASLIAAAPAGPAMTFTLVSDKGTRIVTTSRYVYLSRTFEMLHGSSLAVEIPVRAGDRFEIAVAGAQSSVGWQDIPERKRTTADEAWLRARGASDQAYVYQASDFDVLTAYDDKASSHIAIVRRGDQEIARRTGWPQGLITVGGERHLVVRDDERMQTLRM